jgi:hypothetical protein
MVNLKKLITGFLILAVFVSILASIFSGSGRSTEQTKSFISFPNQKSTVARAAPNNNAFVYNNSAYAAYINEPGLNQLRNKPNLSDAAGENLANVILALNPTGPQEMDGKTTLNIPNDDILSKLIAVTLPPFKIEDLWSNIQEKDFNVVSNYGVGDNAQYAESFRNVIKETLTSPEFLDAAAKDSGLGFINIAAFVFTRAISEMKGLPVPAPFVPFHKSFVQYLEDQRNIFATATNDSDPLKALLVFENQSVILDRIDKDFATLADEYQKLDFKKLFASKNRETFGLENFIYKLLGADVAFAQGVTVTGHGGIIPTIPSENTGTLTPPTTIGGVGLGGIIPAVPSPAPSGAASSDSIAEFCNPEKLRQSSAFKGIFGSFFNPTAIEGIISSILSVPVSGVGQNDVGTAKNTQQIAQINGDILTLMIFECNRKFATEAFRDKVVQSLEANVTESIRNNGNPKFITNYKDYFSKAGSNEADSALTKKIPTLCEEYQTSMKTTFAPPTGDPTDLGGIFSSGNISLGNLGSLFSLTSLFGNNTNFGNLFGNLSSPNTSGNCPLEQISGSPSNFYNNFDNGGWNAYMASMLPSSNYTGSLIETMDAMNEDSWAAAAAAKAQSQSAQGYKSDTTCVQEYTDVNGNKKCAKEQILTPGIVTNQQLQSAVDSSNKTIASAQDITGFQSLIANSLSSRLVSQYQQGLYGMSFQNNYAASAVCSGLGGTLGSLCSNLMGSLISNLKSQLMDSLNFGGLFGF